jgi:hypothetical protein
MVKQISKAVTAGGGGGKTVAMKMPTLQSGQAVNINKVNEYPT